MARFIYITDTHFCGSSNVRTGDYLSDLLIKLNEVVQYANSHSATILHGGDFFDRCIVTDEVKFQLIETLKLCHRPPLCVTGNHDRLYASDDRYTRTSLGVLGAANVLRVLKSGEEVEYPECIIKCAGGGVTVTDSGKTQIVLAHGFLNIEDGLNTFKLSDIETSDNGIVLLGHDHNEYPTVRHVNMDIVRPGAFARGVRNDSSDRIPVMVDIKVSDNGILTHNTVPIQSARPVELIFKTKEATVSKSEVDFETLLAQLKSVSSEELSLDDLLKQVVDLQTYEYIQDILYNNKIIKSK